MKCPNTQNMVAILIGISVIIGVICLARWDYMWVDEFLGKWASAITIISVVTAIPWYFWKKRQDEKDERDKISRNLYGELKDGLDGLDDKRYPSNAITITKGNEIIFFMNRDLNHNIYDSLIFSGKINFLTYELQQEVQDIFKRIKDHNYYLKLTMEMEDKMEANEIHPKAYKYLKWMMDSEYKLLKSIPNMMKKLENDFNVKSIT